MIQDCNYDKAKLLSNISNMIGFLKTHAMEDARKDGHDKCDEMYAGLLKDLEKHDDNIRKNIEECAKEGKFN